MKLIALVRPPPINLTRGCEQHAQYVTALRDAGAEIVEVPPAPDLPDAVFIEDTAFVLDPLAVVARPGAKARRPEVATVAGALSHYRHLVNPPPPVTFDGGDLLVIGHTVYIGLSTRTNQAAIDFLGRLLRPYHYEVIAVPVTGCLHLKTAVTSLGHNMVLINPEWVPQQAFEKHLQIEVSAAEPMGANALRVGNHLFLSASYPRTAKRVEAHGLMPRLLDISEFHRAEGGLTCLSLLLKTAGPS